MNTDALCKASSVPQLSGKSLTITKSTSPTLVTTTAAWDGGALFATPHFIQKFLYEGPSTTLTCFGGACADSINPLVSAPTPTSAPTDSYVPPPAHPVTQFTPAPSCLSKSNLWLVSSRCHLVEPKDLMTRSLPWLRCTIPKAGDPDTGYKTDCYQGVSQHTDRTVGPDSTTTFYSACPVGYTVAHSSVHYPYDEGMLDEYGPTKIYDATHKAFVCCPTHYPFQYNDGDAWETTTIHDDKTHTVQFHRMPNCKATNVWGLANRDVVMTLTGEDDMMLPDRGALPRRVGGNQFVLNQQPPSPTEPPRLTTTRWDVVDKTLWAQAQYYSYVVFHETYTCYENCDQYFTYSYHNTDPNHTPTGPARTVRTRPPAPPPPPPPTPEPKPTSAVEEDDEDSDPAIPPTDPRFQRPGAVETTRPNVEHEANTQDEKNDGNGKEEVMTRESHEHGNGNPNPEREPKNWEEKKDEAKVAAEGAAELYPGVKPDQAEGRGKAAPGSPAGGGKGEAGAKDFYPGMQGEAESEAKKEEVPVVAAGGQQKARRKR